MASERVVVVLEEDGDSWLVRVAPSETRLESFEAASDFATRLLEATRGQGIEVRHTDGRVEHLLDE